MSPRETPRAKPKGYPKGPGYILSNILTRVTIQTFSITTPAFTFLEINIERVDSPYCSDSWAIRKIIAQQIEQYWRVQFQYYKVQKLRMHNMFTQSTYKIYLSAMKNNFCHAQLFQGLKYIFQILNYNLLLLFNFTKFIVSLCWTHNLSFFSSFSKTYF